MVRGMTVAVLTALVAMPAAAQHEEHGQQNRQQNQMQMRMGQQGEGGDHGAFMGPLAGLKVFAPAALLEHGEHLALSAEQVAKITKIKESAAKEAEMVHAPAHAAMMSLRKALDEGETDLEALGSYYKAHNTAMSNTQWINVRAALETRAVLTKEQVAKLREHSGMKHDAMMHKPKP